ncbi:hypothetical protein BGZ72_006175 [Mortierella alpina]|nr:hypothetical protein BGZ72_006175 [Mortierella alpina]
MANTPPGRSPHTTAAPLFTGVLEPSSAPEHPAQGQARGPHTTAASPFSGAFSESSAQQGPQKAELNESGLEVAQYSALSDNDMMDQAQLPPNSSAHVLPPAYGNQEEAYATSAESSDPTPYSAAGHNHNNQDLQHQRWYQEGDMRRSPDAGSDPRDSELAHKNSHLPVNTIQALLPPGSRKRKAVLSCCLVMVILAIVLGVVFGVKKNTGSNAYEAGSPHTPISTPPLTLGNGATQGSTSVTSNVSLTTPTPVLGGLLTTRGPHETTAPYEPPIATTSPTTTTTATTTTSTSDEPSPSPPTPTTSNYGLPPEM